MVIKLRKMKEALEQNTVARLEESLGIFQKVNMNHYCGQEIILT